jgi:hypothetical protein
MKVEQTYSDEGRMIWRSDERYSIEYESSRYIYYSFQRRVAHAALPLPFTSYTERENPVSKD